MKFYLLRHGETEWNKLGKFQGLTDVSLNDRGLAQARDFARAALSWDHSVIYASSLTRTVQVAEEVRKLSGAPVVTEPGLRELSLGDLEGVTGAEMRSGWPGLYETWCNNPAEVAMPNGETISQLQNRAWEVIQRIEHSPCWRRRRGCGFTQLHNPHHHLRDPRNTVAQLPSHVPGSWVRLHF